MSRLTGVVACVIWTAAAAAGRPGRVDRVVRTGPTIEAAPRLCEIRSGGGTCMGDQPRRGDVVIVLDDRKVIAEVQIVEARHYAAGCSTLWTVSIRPQRGVAGDGSAIGVIDASINPVRARTLDKRHLPPPPSGQPGEEVWQAIDRDGDGNADILSTRYSCDASGRPVAGAPTYCIDIWARRTARGAQSPVRDMPRLTRTSQLNFAQCNV